MASLNLKSEWVDDETIKVSWTDVKIRERTIGTNMLIVAVFLGGAIVGIGGALSGAMILLLVWIVACVGTLVFLATKVKEDNSVTIGKSETRHKGRSFPTDQITRFEMGTEAALLGAVSTKPTITGEVNQTIIRMWIDDSAAHDLTKNNWQNQINHEIRDTLDKALKEVRNIQAEEQHEAAHGKVDESGIPEY